VEKCSTSPSLSPFLTLFSNFDEGKLTDEAQFWRGGDMNYSNCHPQPPPSLPPTMIIKKSQPEKSTQLKSYDYFTEKIKRIN
jgi:hypothetical protein